MPIVPPTSTLQTIQNKVRLLTRSPSEAQLTTAQLQQYINTAVVYDFPEQLRTFNLRTQFTFYTNPGQDVYPTDILSFGGASGATTNPLYNFQNIYLTVHDPVFIAGFPSQYSQSRQQFFQQWPILNSIASIGVSGDGVETSFTGVINSQQANIPVGFNQQINLLQNQVLFSSVDLNGNGLAMVDIPLLDSVTGMPTIYGNLYDPNNFPGTPILITAPYIVGVTPNLNPTNYINYSTGQYVVTFDTAPGAGQQINSQTVPQNLSRPLALLFYDNKFTVRPVPDQPYRVDFEAYIRPTALLDTAQSPQLEEWWQYIAYLAAKKVLEDRLDMDSVALILPELKNQELLCLRRTIVQYTNERTATIYTNQTDMNTGYGSGWWGGGQF